MQRFSSPSAFRHDAPERTAILLVQLGTPAAPTAAALRPYLREFLSDPRVVEIPRLIWWLILNGIILNTRPARSAQKYASVWTEAGSPLMAHSRRQTEALREELAARGLNPTVVLAMRYGEPSIAGVLRDLREQGMRRVLVLPLYPQFAGSTTATVIDAVTRELQGWRNLPELRWVRQFHDHPSYLDALAAQVQAVWAQRPPAEKLVMSFHGVPRRTLELGDPYHCECLVTARRLAERLGLPEDRWVVTFQSRFGKAEWLQPYTEPTLIALAESGVRSVDVVCPGFVSDCLETLEEIAMEAKHAFTEAGGTDFNYLGCLNDSPAFIRSLADIVSLHTGGWPMTAEQGPDADALAARAQRARNLGAKA
jgi:ferrochelatase